MSQQRTAAANAARQQASADQMSAVGSLASAGTQIATAGMKMPKLPDGANAALSTAQNLYTVATPEEQAGIGSDVIGGVGTTDYSGGFGSTPPQSPYSKKKDLKINKNK